MKPMLVEMKRPVNIKVIVKLGKDLSMSRLKGARLISLKLGCQKHEAPLSKPPHLKCQGCPG